MGTRIAALVLAAVDPRTLDLAPVRFAAAVAGHTGAPLTVVCVVGDGAAVTPLAAGQSGEELSEDGTAAPSPRSRRASPTAPRHAQRGAVHTRWPPAPAPARGG